MVLLLFSYLIIIANFLFFLIGISNNIGVVGGFMGGLAAIGTDPVVLLLGALLGTGLVARSYKFSVIYLVIGAIFLTMLSHVILGTTKIIVDIVRFDAYLIIPSLIIIVTSFFTPKTKSKIKYTELPIHRPIRIIVLITAAMISGYILFLDTTGGSHRITDTLFGKYVSKSLVKPFHMERYFNYCKVKDLKSSCYYVGESRLMHKLEVSSINQMIKTGQITVLKNKTLKSTYKISMWVVHIILFIISIVAVWKLRFCIAYVITTPMFTSKQKPTKSNFNLKLISEYKS